MVVDLPQTLELCRSGTQFLTLGQLDSIDQCFQNALKFLNIQWPRFLGMQIDSRNSCLGLDLPSGISHGMEGALIDGMCEGRSSKTA